MGASDPRIRFFDAHAATWDDEGPPIVDTLARLDALRDDLQLASGQDVIEVGCGTGQVSEWLAQQVAPGRVAAVDFSAEMIDRARQRGGAAEFIVADICDAECVLPACDVVFCMHAFPHFRDVDAAMANMTGALRDGGRLLILHLASWSAVNQLHDDVGPPVAGDHLPPPTAWPEYFAKAGLSLRGLIDTDDLLLVVGQRG